jgi:hypothetical protein
MATRPLGNVKQLSQTGTGIKVVTVGMGKRFSVNIEALDGNTVDIVGYSMSAATATERGLTRTKHILEAGITVPYSRANTGPMEEVGIEVTAGAGTTTAEILLASDAVS